MSFPVRSELLDDNVFAHVTNVANLTLLDESLIAYDDGVVITADQDLSSFH